MSVITRNFRIQYTSARIYCVILNFFETSLHRCSKALIILTLCKLYVCQLRLLIVELFIAYLYCFTWLWCKRLLTVWQARHHSVDWCVTVQHVNEVMMRVLISVFDQYPHPANIVSLTGSVFLYYCSPVLKSLMAKVINALETTHVTHMRDLPLICERACWIVSVLSSVSTGFTVLQRSKSTS